MTTAKMLFYMISAICVLGAFSVLMRITLERSRLVTRYNHIKKILEHREALRIKVEKKNAEVAEAMSGDQANVLPVEADVPSEDVFTVQPVTQG